MRTLTAIAALTGTLMIPVVGFFNIPAAHADSLTAKESAYVIAYGAGALCPLVDKYHTVDGVIDIVKAVMGDGFTAVESATIIDVSVQSYCPRNIPLLQQTADAIKAMTKGQLV